MSERHVPCATVCISGAAVIVMNSSLSVHRRLTFDQQRSVSLAECIDCLEYFTSLSSWPAAATSRHHPSPSRVIQQIKHFPPLSLLRKPKEAFTGGHSLSDCDLRPTGCRREGRGKASKAMRIYRCPMEMSRSRRRI